MTPALTISGPETAPAVLLLHSIATNGDLWLPQLPAWNKRFRVIRADLPGHGRGARPAAGADVGDFADSLASALDQAQVERFAVVGLSFGAMIALRLAVQAPDRVSALVLANSLVQTPPQGRDMWLQRMAAVETGGMAAQVEPTLARWFTPRFRETAPLTCRWVQDLILATPPEGFCAAAAAIADLDQAALPPQVKAPALVLAGRHDQAAPPQAAAATAQAIPNGRLVELDAAHISNVEQPIAFTETVGDFLLASCHERSR